MYRLGQSLPRPYAGYTYPTKKRRDYVPPTIRIPDIFEFSVTDDVVVSQAVHLNKIILRSIVHDVLVSEIYQKLGRSYTVSVLHDVTASESIRLLRVMHQSVIDAVFVGELYNQDSGIFHHVDVIQEISFTRVIHQNVSHTVNVSQAPFVNSPRYLSVYDNVLIDEFYVPRLATFRVAVTDNVQASQIIIGQNGTYHVSIAHNVIVSQIIRQIGLIHFVSVAHSVNVTDRVNTAFYKSLVHDINVTQTYSHNRQINIELVTTLEVFSAFGRDIIYRLSTDLEEISTWDRSAIFNRDFETELVTDDRWDSVLFITKPGPHPIGSGINFVYGYLTLLESVYGTIVLPVPELNDGIKHNDEIDIKRSMNGILSAYIKKSTTKILNYTWLLDYPKALELKQWALTNFSERVTLTNWKGEIWVGKIISDNITLNAVSKYAGDARQKTSVTILFEGIKING